MLATGDCVPDAFANRTLPLARRSVRLNADHQAMMLPRVKKDANIHKNQVAFRK